MGIEAIFTALCGCLACLNAHLVNPVAERIKDFLSLKKNAEDLPKKTEQLKDRQEDLQGKIEVHIAADSTNATTKQVKDWTKRVNSFKGKSESFDEDFKKRVPSCSPKFGCRENYRLARKVAKLVRDADDLKSERDNIKDLVVRDLRKALDLDVKKLSTKTDTLRSLRDDRKKKVEDLKLENRCMEATSSLTDWFSRVEQELQLATDFHTSFQKRAQSSSSSGGSDVDLLATANGCLESVNKLLEEGKKFTNEDMVRLSSKIAAEVPMHSEVVGQTEVFDKAVTLIDSDEAHIIGIYGMGGAGKTLLLDQINNHFYRHRSGFDVVVKVEIHKEANIERIQEKLFRKLRLESQDTFSSKAERICDRLDRVNFLLLMDDLWHTFDLKEIGIPPLNEVEKKRSMVITTRSEKICDYMCKENEHMIKMGLLSSENSWKLFSNQLGRGQLEHFDRDHSAQKLAREVANECGGLPLALTVLGKAMKRAKQSDAWEYAKEELRENTFPDMEKVITTLKFSYDKLEDHEKQVLLYCSLWPEGSYIGKEKLIDMLLVEEALFDNTDKKFDRRLANKTIDVLLDVGLLMGEDKEWGFLTFYKLHDCVRDMAVRLTDGEDGEFDMSKVFLRWLSGQKWNEFYEKNKWSVAKRISMYGSEVEEIPEDEMPDCDNLVTLLWRGGKIARIPNNFFRCMKHLVVLDLSDTYIEVISDSIGDVHSLRCLNLRGTDISELPKQIGNLVKLVQLILGATSRLQHIPSESISRLCKLEKLDMSYSAYKWKWKEEEEFDQHLKQLTLSDLEVLAEKAVLSDVAISVKDVQDSLLEELANSKHIPITWLEIKIFTEVDVTLGRKFLNRLSGKIRMLDISHCSGMEIKSDFQHLNYLSLDGISEVSVMGHCGDRFKALCRLHLHSCPGVKDLTWTAEIPCLQILSVWMCPNLQTLMCRENAKSEGEPFSSLKHLELLSCTSLIYISDEVLPFPSLESLAVHDCPKLTKLQFDHERAPRVLKYAGDKDIINGSEWVDLNLEGRFPCYFMEDDIEACIIQ